jgi:CRISPR-associated protein Csb1
MIVALAINADLESVNGSKHVYPSTFAGVGHNYVGLDKRNGTADYVLIDSVGSFANRVERELATVGILPEVTTDVGGHRLSINDVPHRAYDAILRDSILDGIPWRKTEVGSRVLSSDASNATALYQHAPLTLLLGGWDSHGGDAGRGTKIARSLSCEIWGHGVKTSRHTTQRIDPLGIGLSSAPHVITDGILTEVSDKTDGGGKAEGKKPSELGHGDVPGDAEKGVFVDEIKMSGSIHMMRLHRYHFPTEDGVVVAERDEAARNVLAKLGLLGVLLVLDSLDLRSGCELFTKTRTFVEINSDGTRTPFDADAESVRKDLDRAIEAAQRHGLDFAAPVHLKAGAALVKLAEKGEI